MKRHYPHRNAPRHSLAAFAVAVALAVVASAAQLWPDITAQSADAMAGLPDGLALVMSGAGIK